TCGACLARKNNSGTSGKFGVYKIVYTYALGGTIGTIWETLLNLAKGNGFVYCNGSILTPFNFVYGIGAVVIICCLRNKDSIAEVFLIGSVGGGAIEFILSFLEETILGTRSWDYTGRLLNIDGRTTVPYMLGWGLLCVVMIFLIYNPFNNALSGMPPAAAKAVAAVIAAIIFIDYAVMLAALVRYVCRSSGIQALTFIGEFIDSAFNDGFMKLHFPKMNFT
ncbi:MAG: putative ABC transporter permease, partial [Clostridia bacterium]|nr:putative ABC transporter permease [Clostridia bacterium]